MPITNNPILIDNDAAPSFRAASADITAAQARGLEIEADWLDSITGNLSPRLEIKRAKILATMARHHGKGRLSPTEIAGIDVLLALSDDDRGAATLDAHPEGAVLEYLGRSA